MERFKIVYGNDPRGKHWAVCDSDQGGIVCSRAWKEEDAKELMRLHNTGEIKPNYEARYIDRDVDEILNA